VQQRNSVITVAGAIGWYCGVASVADEWEAERRRCRHCSGMNERRWGCGRKRDTDGEGWPYVRRPE